eukprot:4683506-Pyramimonas_sp.AAC.1
MASEPPHIASPNERGIGNAPPCAARASALGRRVAHAHQLTPGRARAFSTASAVDHGSRQTAGHRR